MLVTPSSTVYRDLMTRTNDAVLYTFTGECLLGAANYVGLGLQEQVT